MSNGGMKWNMRELLRVHRMTAGDLAKALKLSPFIVRTNVIAEGRMTRGEIETLAAKLGVTEDVVRAALEETRIRPGEDNRGRKPKNASGGAGNGDGQKVSVGVGTAGDGAVSPHGGTRRDYAEEHREAVPA